MTSLLISKGCIISEINSNNHEIYSNGSYITKKIYYNNIGINHLWYTFSPPSDPKQRAFKKGDVLMGEKPYLVRNSDIIKHSSILIGCPIDKNTETLRSGTWSTIRKARKQNLLLYIL